MMLNLCEASTSLASAWTLQIALALVAVNTCHSNPRTRIQKLGTTVSPHKVQREPLPLALAIIVTNVECTMVMSNLESIKIHHL